MPLDDDDAAVVTALTNRLHATQANDRLRDAYFEGEQAIERLGIAVPPQLATLRTVVNWPRLVVETLEERCDVKSFIRSGDATESAELRTIWDANNLDSDFHLTLCDSFVQGRGFVSIGANEENREAPIIAVESPSEMAVEVDTRRRRVKAAFKMYGDDTSPMLHGPNLPKYGTLYLPNATKWLERGPLGWEVVDVDEHNIGRVMVVPFFHRRRTGRWYGTSEMNDAISLTNAACRTLTNLQVAAEAHAVPQRGVLGASKGDFVDQNGAPLPVWSAYFGSVWALENSKASTFQFSASDLRNFHETTEHYARLVAGVYGLPMRYFGINTANPPSADGIRADEARLIKRAERVMATAGDQLGRVMAYALRVRDGEWTETGDRIKVEWHDAATPTYAARVDGVQKLTGGTPLLSRQGGWDELGWSDARKDRERAYIEQESSDPVLERLTREVVDAAAGVG